MLSIIACISKVHRAIGYKNRLLYAIPSDMTRFRMLTTGHTIIMGRKTFESLPNGALPNRRTVKLQVTETLKAIMDETATSDYTDRFGVPLSPAPLRAVSVNAAKALMDIFPIRHKEENRLRIEGSDGNVIFNVIVPQNPVKDGEAET